jgi:hypothetical protein
MGAYDQYDKLTPAEKKYVWANPYDALTIKEDSAKALAEAKKRFGGGSLHNGSGDAFRHCYWNALMARDIDKEEALEFSTAHESDPNNPADEMAMDLHNNAVGADIGAANPNSSDDELAQMCQEVLNTGKLKVLK